MPRPAIPHTLLEGRAALEFGAWLAAFPYLGRQRATNPHPVLVIPGFLAGDPATWPLRKLLDRWGHEPHGWGLGRNTGSRPGMAARLASRVDSLAEQSGKPVSLVGWSLGGVFARELARRKPGAVHCVISLGSPIHGSQSTVMEPLFRRLNPGAPPPDPAAQRRRILSPPVPCSAIYSRSDGVVHWRSALEPAGPRSENIQVMGSHMGLAHNPLALYAIQNRLDQDPDDWQRFRWPAAVRKLMR